MAKKIFFFQDFDHSLKINNKEDKIRELIYSTDLSTDTNSIKVYKKSLFVEKAIQNMESCEDLKSEKNKVNQQTKKVKKKSK